MAAAILKSHIINDTLRFQKKEIMYESVGTKTMKPLKAELRNKIKVE